MKTSSILITSPSADYELIDSGDGEKLERFGAIKLSRPDPQALWTKRLSADEWKKADGYFTREEKGGAWSLKPSVPAKWNISFTGLKLVVKPTAFKHMGLFPEQSVNWEWMENKIKSQNSKVKSEDIEVLNLFGYTGGATLACAQAGAKVVHIDSSKAAVAWARENAELSGLADKPIRWIVEDARVFVEREIKRGRKYDAIIMDPPAFGHGPTSELWKIEEHFLGLIEECKQLLKDKPLFFVINGYSAGYSAVAYENNLLDLKAKYGGEIEIGELAIEEAASRQSTVDSQKTQTRLLPAGIFARWSVE
ncbi:MAG: class I SAM-dependent methyltransferase [Candidatus Pacebacteria bacterium]|nr:class I SAM-dependent methyltransferase [Candidatus Paceibacterota bacterium]